MIMLSLVEAIEKVAKYFSVDKEELVSFANEDAIGGYPERWQIGSIWAVEGKLLYCFVRMLKPETIIEFGTRYGCSTAHMIAAMDKNNKGRIITVDIVGNEMAHNKSPRLKSVQCEGVTYSELMNYNADMIFEDGPHTYEFTKDVIKNVLPHLNAKGILTIHDVDHYIVGTTVTKGVNDALGCEFEHVLVQPSDCGLGFWRKP